MLDKNSMGLDGFVWFFGIVEDRQDPLNLGRVRVRAFGWHDDDLTMIPTESLPWAQVMASGADRNFATPREQDMVVGFFADGRNAQQPFVLGIINGKFTDPNNPGKGFNDLRAQATLQAAPRFIQSAQYKTDGSGIKITEASEAPRHPTPLELNNPTITGAAFANVSGTVIAQRQQNLDTGVKSAAGQTWSEPAPAYAAKYPYNQVYASESGHLIEVDDTPGHERIAFQHRTGSFIEFYQTGSVVFKAVNNRYSITMGDDNVHIMGKCRITVSGDAFVKVMGDANIEATDFNVGASGDVNINAGGKVAIKAAGDVGIQSGGTMALQGNEFNAGGGSYASLVAATTQIDGFVTIEQGGTAPSPDAPSNSVPGAGNKSSGTPQLP